jgi:hypothetical protein
VYASFLDQTFTMQIGLLSPWIPRIKLLQRHRR